MTISAKQVMELRAATGLPLMACKKALEAEGGDQERAYERLRREGLKVAESKAGRATGEGLVRCRIAPDGARGAMVAVLCESEPVSKTALFVEFVEHLVSQVDANAPADVPALLAQPWGEDPGQTVDEVLRGLIAKIGENMRIQGFSRLEVEGEGIVGHYVHHDAHSGALVALQGGSSPDDLGAVAKQLCMHIVAKRPAALSREEIPPEVREKELEIYRAQLQQDPKMSKKPPQVLERIVEGKLDAFYRESVLLEQPWFVDDARTVAEHLKGAGAAVQAFSRFQVGT